MPKEKSRIIKTVRNVMPAVVSIIITKSLDQLTKEFTTEQMSVKGGKKKSASLSIPKEKIDALGMVQVDGSSGFIVDKSGIVLTNRHVVEEQNATYLIVTTDNTRYEAEILARDPVDDIAILKITSPKALPTLPLGDSTDLELGQTVLAFGNALGIFQNTVSMGIISGLSRSITAHPNPKLPPQEMRGLIQTDAAINPGNSGGPLTDIFGRVIGINAAIITDAENISLAIPVHAAVRDLYDLKKYGTIRRPLLGLHYIMLNADLSEKLSFPISQGALVIRDHPVDRAVVPKSPADEAGIKEGDVIFEWNGEKFNGAKSISDFLEICEVGETIHLTALRGKEPVRFSVKLGERK